MVTTLHLMLLLLMTMMMIMDNDNGNDDDGDGDDNDDDDDDEGDDDEDDDDDESGLVEEMRHHQAAGKRSTHSLLSLAIPHFGSDHHREADHHDCHHHRHHHSSHHCLFHFLPKLDFLSTKNSRSVFKLFSRLSNKTNFLFYIPGKNTSTTHLYGRIR